MAYMADHGNTSFPTAKRLDLWDDKIAKDAMVVEMKKVKSIHKACSEDYRFWKMAKGGCKKLIRTVVEGVYINVLKDGTTFFHKVFVCDLLGHLTKNSTGLYALNIVALPMLKHAPCPLQKRSKHASLYPCHGRSPEEIKASRAPHPGYQTGHVRHHLHAPIRRLQEEDGQMGRM